MIDKQASIANAIQFASGRYTMMCLWMALIVNARSQFWAVLTGVPFERAVKYHRTLTSLLLLGAVLHFACAKYTIPNDVFSRDTMSSGIAPLYGALAFFCFAAMALSAIPPIRQRFYRLFLGIHNLYIAVIVFIILHHRGAVFGFIPGILLQAWTISRKLYRFLTPVKASCISVPVNDAEKKVVSITATVPLPYFNTHEKLARLVESTQSDQMVSLDGPFGRLSIKPEIYRTVSGDLVWVVRDVDITALFMDRLISAVSTQGFISIRVTIFNTYSASVKMPVLPASVLYSPNSHIKVQTGRPDIPTLVDSFCSLESHKGENGAVNDNGNTISMCLLTFGPQGLTDDVVKCALFKDIDYHCDIFSY
eukprot:gene10536-21966_t